MFIEIDIYDEEHKIERKKCLQIKTEYGDDLVTLIIKHSKKDEDEYVGEFKVEKSDLRKAITALCS